MQLPDGKVRKTRQSFNDPGQAHELTFCCFKRIRLLGKDRTRRWFVEALDRARRIHGLELWAYVIMPDHAHVLLLPRRDDYAISAILKAIKQPVAQRAISYLKANAPQWLARLRVYWPGGRTGHRFWQQGGGYDRNIIKPATAWSSVDYIHENPVRRGLVDSATDWPWSSAQWYAGDEDVVLAMDDCPPDRPPA
ncbi:MAG: transposase [bacterium]|nr:transposase [bacterium]